jgi:Sodium/calcium exchanger protein
MASSGKALWKLLLGTGTVLCLAAYVLESAQVGVGMLATLMLATGGLIMTFGSCEAMILCVEGLGTRLGWNPFVAGAMAGLAANIPEIVMIGFIVAKEPRVAFVITCLTLHVNALIFGVYSGMLPKDASGYARLPDVIVKLESDLFACAAGVFLTLGMMMLSLKAFHAGDYWGEGLGSADLTAIGLPLMVVQIVAVVVMIRRFAAAEPASASVETLNAAALPSTPGIVACGAVGVLFSFFGGNAIGEFADKLVTVLVAKNYSEMIGAIVVSLFSTVPSFLMIAAAHVKKKYDIALANVSGGVSQMPFVVLPATMLIMAALAWIGAIPHLPHGSVLSIDLETTCAVLFGFPTLLILWKSVTDDGRVDTLETTGMVVVFTLVIYLLSQLS